MLHFRTMPPRFVAAMLNPRGLTARTLFNPRGIGDIHTYNREEVRAVEIPAAYAMNRAGFRPYSDPRELALRQVLFRDIVGARSQS
jgi:hypothetical protein